MAHLLEHDPLLDRHFADAGASANRAAERILAPLRDSDWPEVAWSFSRLTACGYPLELSFGDGPTVRYTAEVAAPEVANSQRLELAIATAAELGGAAPPLRTAQVLASLQRRSPLLFGAWLGARHSSGGDLYKLYAETPRQIGPFEMLSLGVPAADLDVAVSARGVGVELSGDRPLHEVYYRFDESVEPWQVERVIGRFGMGGAIAALGDLVESATGRAFERVAHGRYLGFSIAAASGGGALAFALFCYARRVFGSDAQARQRLLRLAAARGWDFERYAAATASIADRQASGAHGVAAFVVDRRGEASLQVTVCPREVAPQ